MFPYYLAIGMGHDQFWYGDPYLTKCYREAHKMKNEIANQQMWLQGLYNYNAFAVVIANAFRGKSGKTEKYVEQPYDIFGTNEKSSEEKAVEEREKLILALNAYKTMFNKAKGGNNASC